jgi:hypothetical protein
MKVRTFRSVAAGVCLLVLISACSVGATAGSKSSGGAASAGTSSGSASSSGGSAQAVTATSAILNAPNIQVNLPASLQLKLKLKSPRRKAPYDVTTFTDFSSLPGVKSQSWYNLVQNQQNQSPTVSIVQALKYLAGTTNIVLSNSMLLGDVTNFMNGMTLHSNTLYVVSPGTNLFSVWWKAQTVAEFGGGGSSSPVSLPIVVNAYLDLNMADSSHAIIQMYGAILTNGAVMGDIRGFYNGSNNTVLDMDIGMGNSPGSIDYKESYITNNGQTYLISESISPESGYLQTNIQVCYGDATMGGIVSIGNWDNETGDFQLDREIYNSVGDLIYSSQGDTSVPSWAFSWATNNGYNLSNLTNAAPQQFFLSRTGYNIWSQIQTNSSQAYSQTYYTSWTIDNGVTNWDYSSVTNIVFTNSWWMGSYGTMTNYNHFSYSFDGLNWIAITDPVLISNLQYYWGVYFMQNPSSPVTGDATYMSDPGSSANTWTNIQVSNFLSAYNVTNCYTNYFWDGYSNELSVITNITSYSAWQMNYSNFWSNAQYFAIGFQVPVPETDMGISFYVQNSFPLKYLTLDADLAGYSVRAMEEMEGTNIWSNQMGTNIYLETNVYTNYDWWLSAPMWSNQTVFTQFDVFTNFSGYNTNSVWQVQTNLYTNNQIWTDFWYPQYPFRVETNDNVNTNIQYTYFTTFSSNVNTSVNGINYSTNWQQGSYFWITNTMIQTNEDGYDLREDATNNLHINNLEDMTCYYQAADGSMVEQDTKFAYTTAPKPQYFTVIPAASNLISTVSGNLLTFTANNGMFMNLNLNDVWTNPSQGNFPAKWAQISNRFNQM